MYWVCKCILHTLLVGGSLSLGSLGLAASSRAKLLHLESKSITYVHTYFLLILLVIEWMNEWSDGGEVGDNSCVHPTPRSFLHYDVVYVYEAVAPPPPLHTASAAGSVSDGSGPPNPQSFIGAAVVITIRLIRIEVNCLLELAGSIP
jgi:hypothetical protein